MLTFLIIAIINGVVWFVLGYRLGKEESQYYDESELMERGAQENNSLHFKLSKTTDQLNPKTITHEK